MRFTDIYKQAKQTASKLYIFFKNNPFFNKTALPLMTAWFAYILTLIPVSENIEYCKNCATLQTSGNQKLVVYNLTGKEETLFEFIAEPKQSANIHFDKAALDEQTTGLLNQFVPNVPKTAQAIDFIPVQNQESKIFIKVKIRSKPATSNALYFLRDSASDQSQPDFKIKAVGVNLAIEIAQINSNGNNITADKSELKIGNWHTKLTGIQFTVIPQDNTNVAFRFNLPDWNPDYLFEAFAIPAVYDKTSGEMAAQGLGVISETEENQKNVSLLCSAPKDNAILLRKSNEFRNGSCLADNNSSLLALRGFKIGKESVQMTASGHAWAKINGDLTNNVITYIEKNPFLKQLVEKFKALIGF